LDVSRELWVFLYSGHYKGAFLLPSPALKYGTVKENRPVEDISFTSVYVGLILVLKLQRYNKMAALF
jgi:hypothetical protein